MRLNALQMLIEASIADPAREPEFLLGLLDAPVFFHLPLSDDSGRIRLLQFRRPDGLTVIPIFSDHDRARHAAQGNARVASAPGRELLEATRGATLMLDPNDTNCTLYPEELAALLDEGVALPAPPRAPASTPELVAAGEAYQWVARLVAEAVEGIAQVRAVWLAKRVDVPAGSPPVLVAILGVAPAHAERAVRALGLTLASRVRRGEFTLDATAVDPYATPEPWPTALGIAPCWCRE